VSWPVPGCPRGLGTAIAALVLAAALTGAAAGCAAPQFTYVSDSGAQTYFKVPYGWHQITSASLAAQLKNNASAHGIWEVGYDAAPSPSAQHVFSPSTAHPFTLALVFPVNPAASRTLTDNSLRDLLLPVTAVGRQAAALRGFPLTRFRLLHDAALTADHGVHGIRETFDYTYPNGYTDTFDQVALTNAGHTQVYVLMLHCLATCYRQHQKEIETVMRSFTVGNS
jgi:hypothetical protein